MRSIASSPTPRTRRKLPAALTTAAVLAVLTLAFPRMAAAQADADVTFTKDVAPILQRSCQNCHRRARRCAPMSLMTYEEVRPWARAIKHADRAARDAAVVHREERRHPAVQGRPLAERRRDRAHRERGWTAARRAAIRPTCRRRASSPTARTGRSARRISIVSSPERTIKAVAADWHGDSESDADRPHRGSLRQGRRGARKSGVRAGRSETPRGPARRRAALNIFVDSPRGGHHRPSATGRRLGPRGRVLERPGFNMTHELGQNATIYPDGARRAPAGRLGRSPGACTTHSVGEEVEVRIDVGFKFHPKGYTAEVHAAVVRDRRHADEQRPRHPGRRRQRRFDAMRSTCATPAHAHDLRAAHARERQADVPEGAPIRTASARR